MRKLVAVRASVYGRGRLLKVILCLCYGASIQSVMYVRVKPFYLAALTAATIALCGSICVVGAVRSIIIELCAATQPTN